VRGEGLPGVGPVTGRPPALTRVRHLGRARALQRKRYAIADSFIYRRLPWRGARRPARAVPYCRCLRNQLTVRPQASRAAASLYTSGRVSLKKACCVPS